MLVIDQDRIGRFEVSENLEFHTLARYLGDTINILQVDGLNSLSPTRSFTITAQCNAFEKINARSVRIHGVPMYIPFIIRNNDRANFEIEWRI